MIIKNHPEVNVMSETEAHTNRLINEKSPYLLQHAHNPVDWYPWCDEAFEKAKAEDKPIFLSIGYSTCHWCHVMERESFEDEQVAELLNRNFVSVKVDREERPDVDNLYMEACMALTGSGGWPLSCFLTPDKRPFYAGTYFPKNDGPYGIGFLTLLRRISELWKTRREDLLKSSDEIMDAISRESGPCAIEDGAETKAFEQLERSFDGRYGGFGGAPKFPSLQNLMFLTRYGLLHNCGRAFEMVKKTLDSMYQGGIFDHVGGGFCRYSTDRMWLVPHFEKMMYDNAMMIIAYSEAAALFGGHYADIARMTTEFCLREMKGPEGCFYTAIDADSEGAEGKFYLFSPDEVVKALGKPDGERFCRLFNITPRGSFEGKSIPNLIGKTLSDGDLLFSKSAAERLYKYRSRRIPPFLDDKSLAMNNGLMTAALAIEGRILKKPEYIEYAEKCADFVLTKMIKNGRLTGRWRAGEAAVPATSDDYAAVIFGLIELYESTFKPERLIKAVELTRDMNALFWDDADGGYFLSGSDVGDLPARRKNTQDGALPSGNSIAALNLLRLARLCANAEFEEYSNRIIKMAAPLANAYPSACCGLLSALLYLKDGGTEIVLARGDGFEDMLGALPAFSPFTAVCVLGKGCEQIYGVAPNLRQYKSEGGKATAYVCHKGSCSRPVTSAKALKELINNGKKVK